MSWFDHTRLCTNVRVYNENNNCLVSVSRSKWNLILQKQFCDGVIDQPTLSICVPPRKTTMAASKSFSSVASGIWNALPNHLSSVPTLPVFRRALKHHLFLLAYPDSSAKSDTIKPAQCITLRDSVPTTAIAQPGNTMPPI